MICYLYPNPIYLLFSHDVPALLYYAQIPATIIALLLGFYIFWNGRKFLLNRLLFLITVLFSLWTFTTLIVWAGNDGGLFAFVWPFYDLILGFIAIFCIYFIYVFLDKKDVLVRIKVIFLTLLAPILILAPTNFNLGGFNITNCDAFDFESLPLKIFTTSLGVLAMVWILILLIRKYRISDSSFKKQIILMGTGIEFFLFSFFGMEFLATYLVKIGILPNSQLELYGLFGMVIFMIYISILIVRFKAFDGKLFATQVLVWGLVILIGSEFFFTQNTLNIILIAITLVVSAGLGLSIIRSVKKEIENNIKLKAFDVLKSQFLSLASHQLRNPITTIISCTSMFLDGSFGDISELQKKMLSQMLFGARNMNGSVETYLTLAKIEQGGLQYNMAKLDMAPFAKEVTEQQKLEAEKRNLVLSFEADGQSSYFVNGDKIHLTQVLQNLIDNALKHTKEGWIKVKLSKDETVGKIKIVISDSGEGIKPEIMPKLFKEFSRGEGAKMDVMGSGIGLFLAKEIIEKGHHGKIWAESEGAGKGASFIFELPIAQ